jgi:hypothetical protein
MGRAWFKSPLAHQYDPRPDLGGLSASEDPSSGYFFRLRILSSREAG